MPAESTRVIVLGSGPAGLSAARMCLNKRVSKILVIDQGKHDSPTYSACLEHLGIQPLLTGGLGGSTSSGWGAQLGILGKNDLDNWRQLLNQTNINTAEVSALISGMIEKSKEMLEFCGISVGPIIESSKVDIEFLKKFNLSRVSTFYPPDGHIPNIFRNVISSEKIEFQDNRVDSLNFDDKRTILNFDNGNTLDVTNDLVIIALGCVEATNLLLKSFPQVIWENKITTQIRDHPSTYLFTFRKKMGKRLSDQFRRQANTKNKFALELQSHEQSFRSGFFEFQEIDNQVIRNGSLVTLSTNNLIRFIGIIKRVLRKILPSRLFTFLVPMQFVVWAQIEQERNSENVLHLKDQMLCSSWRLQKQDCDDFRRILEVSKLCVQELGGIICNEVDIETLSGIPNSKVQAAHPSGTLKIHSNPKLGLINMRGQVQGKNNLIVASSAAFPSDGWVNPTLTIMAYSSLVTEQALEQLEWRGAIF